MRNGRQAPVRPARCGAGLAVALLLMSLTACTGAASFASGATSSSSRTTGSPSTGAPSSTSQTTSPGAGTSGPEPSLGPSFPADTSPDGGPAQAGSGAGSAGPVNVSLQMDTHPGYGRLVVALSTPGVPSWTVAYSDKSGPGGGPVELAGDAFLRVVLKTGGAAGGQGSSNVTASGIIAGVRTLGVFEGSQEVLIGISGGQKPFRAYALTDPGRIVIDVREP